MSAEPDTQQVSRPRRPLLFVVALSFAVIVGWGGVANGCNTVQFYRATTLAEPPLRAGADTKEQEEAAAFQRALRPVHDGARDRRLPLGVANLLLSGLLVFAATRALGGRAGARELLTHALVANALAAVADFALTASWRHEMARTVGTHFPRAALRGREGLTEAETTAMLGSAVSGIFVTALLALLAIYGLALFMLRSPAARAYFQAVAEETDEREE